MSDSQYLLSELTIGRAYDVSWDDGSVEGSFRATLEQCANGVTLWSNGVLLTDAAPPGAASVYCYGDVEGDRPHDPWNVGSLNE